MRPTLFIAGVLMVIVLAMSACSIRSTAVGPGEEAVLVRQPVFLTFLGGVDSAPVKTGRKWHASSTRGVIINMQPVAFHQSFDDMNSSDGVPLDFNAQMTLQVTDSVRMVKEFGTDLKGIYDRNIAKEFESLTRKAVRNHGEAQIATTAIDQIDQFVESGLRAHIQSIRIPFRLREVTVGKSNPPDSIEQQRIDTAAQRQRKNTENERNQAEIARKMAEESRAAADRAYNDRMGITTQENVELKKTELLMQACAKGGCTFLLGSGATPLISLK